MKKIAILASGSGTNAENLIHFFRASLAGRVEIVLTNKSGAGVIARSESLNVETVVFNREQFYEKDEVIELLKEREIDLVVLAGFLWLVPSGLIRAFEGRIINIHPALLPNYGGKGMYGNHVHQAVIDSGDTRSGITIHYVNQEYDAGSIIFQAMCEVREGDTPEELATRIHELEYEHYPRVIEQMLDQL
ncbi:MAG: phosphoribosylglycinamide formyltransferase [Bacteroidetes bacterium]|nr:phosphoribosylglycinamide formyltransferase [Bacteroidota bacterium]